MLPRLGSLAGVVILAIGLGGCPSQEQLAADAKIAANFGQAVVCATGGVGGGVTLRIEKAVKAKQAWVGTTGDIIAASAEICAAIRGQ